MVDTPFPNGPELLAQFHYWVYGFMLQSIIYGVNVILFLMSLWVLAIHLIKGSDTIHRFHKHHRLQNCLLLLFSVVMFALSTAFMAHQGIMASDTWTRFLNMDSLGPSNTTAISGVVSAILTGRPSLQKTCITVLVLVNWGATGILLWRCLIHWKVRSVFPSEIMALPYLIYATSIAAGLVRILCYTTPRLISESTKAKNWDLINWSIATGLYYLMTILNATRILYHRHTIRKEVDPKDVDKLASYLTIFYDSGAVVLPFSTAYLIALARFPHLRYIFQSTVTQNQVMLALLIVQRLSAGRAWSGKTIDCILNSAPRKQQEVSGNVEEVTTMGFNPNTGFSSTQNDGESQRSVKREHDDLTIELRGVVGNKV
ncbi:hypothetical protein AN958_06880 [Leucoagaricus sp. SymC.cos]|nr:hypothetical protein AN958_06880 [Leucoagaricus sp. SymC.cos]